MDSIIVLDAKNTTDKSGLTSREKKEKKDKPWITKELKAAIRRKHRVYKKYRNKGENAEEWERCKNIKNETTRMLRLAKEAWREKERRKQINITRLICVKDFQMP